MQRSLMLSIAPVALAAILSGSTAWLAQAQTPIDGRIVRVVYQVGGAPGALNPAWGFHLAHMRDGRYCVRLGNPGRRLMLDMIEKMANICFEGMPATVDRSPERTYQAIDASDGKEKTFVSFSRGSIAASGNAILSKCIDDREIHACDRIIERGNLDKMKLASIHGMRSSIHESKSDLDHAIADLDQAIRLTGEVCPDCWALAFDYTMRAVYYGRKGELDRAILDYSESIRIAPKWGHNYAARAHTYVEKGDYERALADISQAIASRPGRAFAYMYAERAMIYGKMRQAARGLPDADRAIELDPKFGEAHFFRAQLYEALGRNEEAIADFRRALALEPARTDIADELKRLGAQP